MAGGVECCEWGDLCLSFLCTIIKAPLTMTSAAHDDDIHTHTHTHTKYTYCAYPYTHTHTHTTHTHTHTHTACMPGDRIVYIHTHLSTASSVDLAFILIAYYTYTILHSKLFTTPLVPSLSAS